jgi:hypothetical protein
MAVVGQLLVELSANVARLRTDMEAATRITQENSDRMAAAANSVKTALGAIGAALTVGEIVGQFKTAVSQLSAFDDAAERTGASVESLSSIFNTLAPTGVTLDQITAASEKLVKAMIGADKETGKAAEAFDALGIKTRDAAGNLRPVDQVLQEIADSLNKYEDGANKTAIAQALLGKSGGEYLPLLKDLAGLTREAATVTTEQAGQAEKLENAFRKLSHESDVFKQQLAMGLIPKLVELIEQFRVGREMAGGFFAAIYRYGLSLGGPADNIVKITKNIGDLQAKIAADQKLADGDGAAFGRGARNAARERVTSAQGQIEQLTNDLRYYATLQKQIDAAGAGQKVNTPEPRKPQAPKVSSGITPPKPPKVEREDTTDRQNYTRLIDQLYAQMDLTEEQKLALRVTQEALPKQSQFYQEGAAGAARMSDLLKQQKKDQDALTEALKNYDMEDSNVAESQRLATITAMREQTSIALQGSALLQKARDELYGTTDKDKVKAYLKELQDAGMAAGFEIDKVKELLEGTKDAAKDLLAPIESAFESIVVNGGSARQVLQGLLSDITKILLRTQITKPLMGALDKAVSGSGGLAGLLGGLFTKPSAEAIALASGIAPLASGGPMEAGHPYLVGEQGPELVVPKSAGTVIPNHALGGSSVYLTYNIAPGVSASQVMQALNATREQTKADIMESMRRGGAFARA